MTINRYSRKPEPTGTSRSGFRHRYLGGPRFSKPRRKKNWRRIIGWLMIGAVALLLAGMVGGAALFAWFAKDLPDPNNLLNRQLAQTTRIYDRTGEHLLYEVHGDQKRTVVELTDISDHVKQATIAAEDRNFYTHSGFSIRGYARAFLKNITSGGRGEGGSTITQQFVKNAILTKEKTYTRKLKELVLSIEIERKFSKDEILKMYLNEIPYGSVTYGIESAAQSFLGKSAKDLTLSEAALLASVPKASTYYSPLGNHREELLDRSRFVIDTMVELGMVDAATAAEAKDDNVLDRIKPRLDMIEAPHFVLYVKDLLAEKLGDSAVEQGGLKVITTLDWDMQQAAQQAVDDGLEKVQKAGGNSAALLALDPKTGDILAMIGSPDYFDEENRGMVNYLTRQLQPGSSIKPFVYAAAIEQGFTPDTVVYDVKTNFTDAPSEPYVPANYDLRERGPITLKESLAGSLNIPTIKALYLAGIENFLKMTEAAGYTSFGNRSAIGLSIGIGANEVKPLEHIAAFSSFVNDGEWRPTKAILRVEQADGTKMFEDDKPTPKRRAMEVETARNIAAIMSNNDLRTYVFGASNWLTLGDRPVAAKTGTTQKFKDAWTVGFTPSLVAGVWTGRAEGGPMGSGADGSQIAAPIWNNFMREALKNQPIDNFTAPEPIVTGKPVLDGSKNAPVTVKIDSISGKLATDMTPSELIEELSYFVPHDILQFVTREDPRGAAPTDPTADAQYDNWEAGIADWAKRQGLPLAAPNLPTEYDDVHTAENLPQVQLTMPQPNETWHDRQVWVGVNAYARRGIAKVEYALDGDVIGVVNGTSGQITVPNRVGRGYHTLTAIAYDDVGNRATSEQITVNLLAEPGPLGIVWTNRYGFETIYAGQFPLAVTLRLDDPRSIRTLKLTAVATADHSRRLIGSIANPTLPNLSFSWTERPPSGDYSLMVEAELVSGDWRTETLSLRVN